MVPSYIYFILPISSSFDGSANHLISMFFFLSFVSFFFFCVTSDDVFQKKKIQHSGTRVRREKEGKRRNQDETEREREKRGFVKFVLEDDQMISSFFRFFVLLSSRQDKKEDNQTLGGKERKKGSCKAHDECVRLLLFSFFIQSDLSGVCLCFPLPHPRHTHMMLREEFLCIPFDHCIAGRGVGSARHSLPSCNQESSASRSDQEVQRTEDERTSPSSDSVQASASSRPRHSVLSKGQKTKENRKRRKRRKGKRHELELE